MSQQQLISDLKSSTETAKNALEGIYGKISKCKDNAKTKSSLSYNAVHAICMAIRDKGEFYDIYTDAIEKLAVNISNHHWNMFVELLRYILGEFYTKSVYDRTASLAVLARADRIITPDDVKSHLKLYSRQLFYGHPFMSDEKIKEIFKCITGLLTKCKEIEYEDLIVDFYSIFLGFQSMLQNVVVKHMEKAAPMFEKLFAAIGTIKINVKLSDSFILLTKFLVNFIYLDVTDKNSVLSQNFLRSCKENQSLKEHKYQNYAINLFYYFVKLLLFPNTLDFNKNFHEILGKFSVFFDRSDLASEPWFMDTVVTMTRILDAFKGQKHIFQAMNEESLHEAFTFIEKLMKLAHGVNYESSLWTCCNSVRKHVIFKLCLIELIMFETVVEHNFTKYEFASCVYTILKHTIAVAEFFKCNTVNYEIALLMNTLSRCAQNVKAKEHGEQLAKLLILTTKAKAYLPENSVRTLAKCLMHVYKIAGDSHGQAEACALYTAHLVAAKGDTDLIRRSIGLFYSLEPCTGILETLDLSTFPLKPEGFSRRLLHSMEASVFCKMRDRNILTITSLLKSSETIIDFVLIARQCPQVNVSEKLEQIYRELKEKSTLTPVEHLAFGYICKIQAVQQMDELKNLFSVSKLSDESLPSVTDPNKLKLMDITIETQIMKLAMEGVESFSKFFEFASQHPMSEEDFFVDWESIIDDVAMLARLFAFRGYLDYAYISWRLLHRIAIHLDDILNQLRALSFICDECLFVELYDPEFNFEKEIRNSERGMYECVMNLEFLTPRRQNYVLVCLCNIAWYLAQKSRFQESQLHLDLVLLEVEKLEERKGKFELVRATHLAVSFRIQWKLKKELSKRKAFFHVDKILDEIRAVVYYTSEDALNFPTLLFGVVADISEFTTNRMCEPATLPYVQMVLKLALDAGAAFRVVQFLVLWTHINLQSENVTKCQIKLDIIDILYGNIQPSKSILKANLNVKLKNHLESGPIEPYRIYGEEAVRKAVYLNPVSPVRIKHEAPTIHRELESFLVAHEDRCTCEKCSHTFLKWQFFKVGCIHARLLYLADINSEPDIFYTKAVEWCAKTFHKSHTKFHFRDYELSMLVHFINLLRRMGNFKAALTIGKASTDAYNKFKDALDGVHFINLFIQMETTTAAMQQKPTRSSLTARRLFKFSPPDTQPTSIQPTTAKRRGGRQKKESPKTIRENIENIIYKEPTVTLAVSKSRAKDVERHTKRKEKNTDKSIDEICKTVEHLNEVVPKKPTSIRRGGRTNLNTAIIIIDDNDSPEPTEPKKIPKSASKVECTPKTRGRSRRLPPATIAVTKMGEMDARRRRI